MAADTKKATATYYAAAALAIYFFNLSCLIYIYLLVYILYLRRCSVTLSSDGHALFFLLTMMLAMATAKQHTATIAYR